MAALQLCLIIQRSRKLIGSCTMVCYAPCLQPQGLVAFRSLAEGSCLTASSTHPCRLMPGLETKAVRHAAAYLYISHCSAPRYNAAQQ